MYCSPNPLKRVIQGITIGVMKGDTRSSDYGSYGPNFRGWGNPLLHTVGESVCWLDGIQLDLGFRVWGLGLESTPKLTLGFYEARS